MKIGELARKADCPVETIRYYEKEGLLQAPLRDIENNYRRYNNTHLEKLLFIRRCRSLDMTHKEIRALLLAMNNHGKDCGPIDAIISAHLTHVQHRIKELIALEIQLKELNNYCSSDRSVDECGIVQKLTADEENGDLPLTVPTDHSGGVH
ncbi:Cd(II)/Pb(II)-responsive transcriptional regulator [Enterobacter hormaechei]|uniref:MerR family transcriptional regulator n=1 Tax=Enterobacter chengduensis TaxID=2494701 RepID=A0AAW3HKK5_9ENTR|nr:MULTISPECIES: Cd(II)/Pb(II)-responsive transcriptional regulator [Enterobacter cloacae complex]ELT9549508.1 Cd(II)/Pb(II)-responsive transcriptional regulator [Citrobacter freundii]MBT1881773.1 Cd(II)/Pb(II)-responsive transcriptional regulator [Enterobacter hormaechei subsp. xiangfangensis]OTW35336.1 Cd(II)/Pb(II)-responsive transcriptional regulator [Enterobacter kobei]ELC7274654.1 Cd(II)/Pb(II)-responsive transcriptional regulator [Enterobacter hormaechei]KJX37076.1 MerR family transcrip